MNEILMIPNKTSYTQLLSYSENVLNWVGRYKINSAQLYSFPASNKPDICFSLIRIEELKLKSLELSEFKFRFLIVGFLE